jgi:hypothetical protein
MNLEDTQRHGGRHSHDSIEARVRWNLGEEDAMAAV